MAAASALQLAGCMLHRMGRRRRRRGAPELPAALSGGWQRDCNPALLLFLLGKLSCHAPEPCTLQGPRHLAVSSQEGPRAAVGCGQSSHKAREERDCAERVLLGWVRGRGEETACEKLGKKVALGLAPAAQCLGLQCCRGATWFHIAHHALMSIFGGLTTPPHPTATGPCPHPAAPGLVPAVLAERQVAVVQIHGQVLHLAPLGIRSATPEQTCGALGPTQLPRAWERPQTAPGETVASFLFLAFVWGTLLLNQSSNKLCAPGLRPACKLRVPELLCPQRRLPSAQQATPR